LDNGANINQPSQSGSTALIEAAREGRTETVKLLLQHGADPALKDRFGRTAFDEAENEGHEDVAKLLKTSR
ncbi:MAG: ankyrin repeat domain-containing protein, partial [SAR324 cluster bacterium]|nr:ankyrin repeat domain-containing protein [SAR324 cluster bacterium]